MCKNVMSIENLSIYYGEKCVVQHVNLSLKKGEILTVVGESGSGKSTLLSAISGLLNSTATIETGTIYLEETPLHENKTMYRVNRKDMTMIFQNPGAFFNPMKKIGKQYEQYLCLHGVIDKQEQKHIQKMMLEKVHLCDVDRVLNAYPFELSGGMQQRVSIAMATTFKPKLLLADEPTSALDVTTQADIVKHFIQLSKEETAILMVTHNMSVASYLSDKIAVMKDGRIIEYGNRDDIIYRPKEAYTKALIEATPSLSEVENG
ncbi:ABC transporter ATP-binding protein [Carnobacteriaceae bacterium zg-84]|nr:ATP-binding cassette domain-containing protein [Granulicatella sp. zg-84]QMI85050.1 ABC transporter ATP-binding protein [Carnobacteriaceae bacterium zg-84]